MWRQITKSFKTNLLKQQQQHQIRKSTTPSISSFQKECWESYLSSGRESETLFHSIDQSRNGLISSADIQDFLESVNHQGVNSDAFRTLQELSSDHQLDIKEFKAWLIMATKFSPGNKNTVLKSYYETHPEIGQRYQTEFPEYSWNEVSMSQSLRRMQYAVRGSVVMRADQLKAQGQDILFTNIGNPHAVGQKPITFYRQVLALCDLPQDRYGLQDKNVQDFFPGDVIQRTKEIRSAIGPAGTGAYTGSQGILEFRKDVAKFISDRDGHDAFEGNIFLTNGASSAIDMVLTALIADNKDAIMIPIPQYPIYSAIITRLGGRQVGYELEETLGWAVTQEELDKQYHKAKDDGLNVKALVLINPGNPTGQVLDRKDLELICKFCTKNNIVLLADEVYQSNVYDDTKQFLSAKKIAVETPECNNKLQLISFHSTSKGLIGECGRRGGYMHLHHICPYVQSQIYKLASSGLCSAVTGQIMTSLMVKGPAPGDESFDLFQEENQKIFDSLKRRSRIVVDGLNSIEGIDCQNASGAMYAFPRISNLPLRAHEAAELLGYSVDTLYALSLLEETGICVVPADGFGQKAGRSGFRTTFLPPEDKIIKAVDEFARHHKLFMEKYE